MSLRFVLGRENVPCVTEVVNRSLKAECADFNLVDENSLFIFIVCDKSVLLYHFKLAYVVLQMAVKEFFAKPTSKNVEIGRFNLKGLFWTNLGNQWQRTADFVSKALKDLYFVLC